jgi:hypothetical protein
LNGTSEKRLDQHLLVALRVLHLDRLNGHVQVVGQRGFERLDGIRLVVLDADHRPLDPERLHHHANPELHALRIIHHDPVVRSQIGLTLGGVHDQGLHVHSLGRE